MKTLKALLQEGRLALEHSDSPALDAELLMMALLKVNRAYLYAHPEREIDNKTADAFLKRIQRRKNNEPVAYILGRQEFWSLDFKVTPDVLIPRPETEHLVAYVLEKAPQQARIIDLGTGSGAIACALAHECPNWEVIATDRSWQAISLAKENAHRLGVNIDCVLSNWLLPFSSQSFDVIVSNPPYIEAQDPHLKDLTFEPISALVAAQSGLADLTTIVQQGKFALKPNGFLVLEHGSEQGAEVRALAHGHFQQVETLKDLAGLERMTWFKDPVASQ